MGRSEPFPTWTETGYNGFGHPFENLGPVGLPIIEARVLGEISNRSAPFKFATLNPTVRGTLTEDEVPGVRGVLGAEPELVPIRSRYTFPSGSELELTHRMPTVGIDPFSSLSLLTEASFGPLGNRVANEPDHSVRVTTNISFAGTDSVLARTRLYADPAGRLFSLLNTASGDLSFALLELVTRNDYALQVSDAELHVEMIREPGFAQVADVSADTVVSPGSTLDLTVDLRVGRRADREIGLELTLPDTLPGRVSTSSRSGPPPTWWTTPKGISGSSEDSPVLKNMGLEGGEETLEEVFARLNAPDENVVLKARLTFFEPLEPIFEPTPESSDEGEPGSGHGSRRWFRLRTGGFVGRLPASRRARPPTVSTEQEVGLVIGGTQALQITVGSEDVVLEDE